MGEYKLQEDEILFYRGDVTRRGVKKVTTKLILTNTSLVFEMTENKLFGKGETECEIYPVSDIKVYNEQPQVK